MIFDKLAFNQHAETHIKKLIPAAHIEALDGMNVEFENDRFGSITNYEVDGEEFYLYPVCREWCTEVKQMSLWEEIEC